MCSATQLIREMAKVKFDVKQMIELMGSDSRKFGWLLAGTLGHKDRLQYTVIGDTVNVAARLCQQGPIDQIVLSVSTLKAIEEIHPNAAQTLYHQDLGQWQVRGRDETVTVYQSLSLPDTLNHLIQQRKKLLTFQLSIKPELEHDLDDR